MTSISQEYMPLTDHSVPLNLEDDLVPDYILYREPLEFYQNHDSGLVVDPTDQIYLVGPHMTHSDFRISLELVYENFLEFRDLFLYGKKNKLFFSNEDRKGFREGTLLLRNDFYIHYKNRLLVVSSRSLFSFCSYDSVHEEDRVSQSESSHTLRIHTEGEEIPEHTDRRQGGDLISSALLLSLSARYLYDNLCIFLSENLLKFSLACKFYNVRL